MPIQQRLKDGSLVVLTPEGWRKATNYEELASQASPGEAFLSGAPSTLLDVAQGLSLGATRLYPQGTWTQEQADLSRSIQNRQEIMGPLEEAQPGAFMAGAVALDPLTYLGLPGIGKISGRVAARIAQAGAKAGEGIPKAPGMVQRIFNAPKSVYRDFKKSALDFMSPEALSPDQKAMIPVGDRLGFKFFPGQKEGMRGLRRLASSDPIIEGAFAGEYQANRQGLRRAAARSIGVQADDFSRDMLGATADRTNATFEALADEIGPSTLPDTLADKIERVRPSEQFIDITEEGTLDGRGLLQLKTQMETIARNAWQKPGEAAKAEFAEGVANDIVELIQGKLSGESQNTWKIAKQEWKNLKVLESPNVLNAAGEVNVLTLNTRLDKFYGATFRRQLTGEEGRRAGLSPATRDLMDWARLGAQFADNFPNSGTALRSRLVRLVTDPKELYKSVALRMAIEAAIKAP